MPNLKHIKSRIQSVQNTAKITNAMKLVSAAKFARASQAVAASRPYTHGFNRLVGELLGSAAAQDWKSPLTEVRPVKKALIVILATDRGLCGGLNTNLFKAVNVALKEYRAQGVEVSLIAWGRRAASFAKGTGLALIEERERVLEKPNYSAAKELAEGVVERYLTDGYDALHLAYSEFKSALSQEPQVRVLLPLVWSPTDAVADASATDYLIEPSPEAMLGALLDRTIAVTTFQAMLEAAASEHGSRMTAMDSATSNARDVKQKLTLQYNRARQAAITTELIEITAGAEAL